MNYVLVNTFPIDFYSYIDVAYLDGNIVTQLMRKKEEPNVFENVYQVEGDNVEHVKQYAKENPHEYKAE